MEKEQKIALIRVFASLILLLVAKLAPLGEVWNLVVCLVAYLTIGGDVLWRAGRNILHGEVFDENFLMGIATIGAFALGDYAEAVAVMLFYQVGEIFQDVAVGRSRASISDLMDIRPDTATVEVDGELRQVDPETLKIGDAFVVKPGDKVPLDGVVLEGSSSLNTMALTGESLPRDVAAGDAVISGCVNLSGLLRVRATNVYGESTAAKILDLVENSSANKAKAEHFITKFARVYTPAVVGAAVCLAVLPPLFVGEWLVWLNRALIFLVISCPCALVISVPLSFFGGLGGASRQGILVKGSNYLEALAATDEVVFDKTGTLTKGTFTVTAIHPSEVSEERLLEMAALAESYSNHPISASLRAAYNRAVDKSRLAKVEDLAGRGIRAVVDGKTVCAGNEKLMTEIGADWHACSHPGTIVHVAVDGAYMGHIVISDTVKPESKEAIAALKRAGVQKTVMLTGDRRSVGEAVAKELGVDEVHAELLPDNKVERVEALLKEKNGKGKLAFVGDGVNDAPVLARADVGIAMGALGADAAIEAADVVLMDDDPGKIARAIEIARATLAIVRQNIVFALVVKALVLLLGALGIANMWWAVFADVGVAMLAVLNAMRAMRA